ncbi:hypothetical protein [Rhizobium sp. BK251]|uniref:hypothetical protein n=1 Tax=Rhizobium sp. BK251 TaxID=2512125 RepID=UPI001050BAB1|nr:hypothetical protein [Rhizobium sp. BK251]TCL69878.1 hypothetical protein EV286_108456 [Rhizobium sp. BK251]
MTFRTTAAVLLSGGFMLASHGPSRAQDITPPAESSPGEGQARDLPLQAAGGFAGWGHFGHAGRLGYMKDRYDSARLRLRIGMVLSAQETAIGIRADQQAAWRAYTQAIMAMVPENEVVHSIGASEDEPQQAFGRAEHVADALIAYSKKAQDLKLAVTELRKQLTAEQLDRARFPG